jgi:hypothetical protein
LGKNARQLLERGFSVEHAVNEIFRHLGEVDPVALSSRSKSRVAADFRMHPPELAENSKS